MIMTTQRVGTNAGQERMDFEQESGGQKSVEIVQPMDRPLEGQRLINAVQSALPKVTSYPY